MYETFLDYEQQVAAFPAMMNFGYIAFYLNRMQS